MISEHARQIRGGIRSARDSAEAALDLAEGSQPLLNAFSSVDREGALGAAGAIDDAVAAGRDPGPLGGVPIAVKDLIDHAGRPNTLGTSLPPAVPEETATCLSRIEQAGAVVIGRTVLHEYAFGFSSENHWFGPVSNPWDPALSPGGSSGGSAAAVAAGVVPAALGTDTGGSVRVPAAMCGIVGLKVTHGRVPLTGVFPLAPLLDTVGPLTRSVADAASIYAVMAGDDPADPFSAPVAVAVPSTPAEVSTLRIGVPHPWVDRPLSEDQERGFAWFLEGLAGVGARVVDVEVPELAPSEHAANGSFFEVANVHRERFAAHEEAYGPEVRERVRGALEVTGSAFLDALAWRRSTAAAAQRALAGVDVLVTPTAATLRKTIGEPMVNLGGEPVHYVNALSVFSAPVNHVGFPALALPLATDGAPPPSVQLIAGPWEERLLLEIGLRLEIEGLVGARRPPHWRPGVIATNAGRDA